jgi:two-component system, response regulator
LSLADGVQRLGSKEQPGDKQRAFASMSEKRFDYPDVSANRDQESTTVVIAEDNEDDITLLENALAEVACENTIRIVRDGQELLDYLRGEGKYADRRAFPFPNVLLLDIKMPRVNGLEVLRWLSSHPECSVMPTVVFSASNLEDDVAQAYELGANAYFVKPMTFQSLKDTLRSMFEFWGKCTKPRLPQKCAH